MAPINKPANKPTLKQSTQPLIPSVRNLSKLTQQIKVWGQQLGFQQVGISDTTLDRAEKYLNLWLDAGYHGDMAWMAEHGSKRSRPRELVPNTVRTINVALDYMSESRLQCRNLLQQPDMAYISRYALGRDYHKLMRKRLQKLADKIHNSIGEFGYRVFVDSAPVLEKPLAEKAGLGWIGKHTNLIQKQTGSWFFLGEIYTDLALPVDNKASNHCGRCRTCLDVCPTQAIIAPYQLDARRCISYLTIENRGSIPTELRPLIGNRIYGCDDCQLYCPWNRFAGIAKEKDFQPRHQLDDRSLIELFSWEETVFLNRLQGSPIRRIGHEAWLRNIAVALGNAGDNKGGKYSQPVEIIQALNRRRRHPSRLVQEHVHWALAQYQG